MLKLFIFVLVVLSVCLAAERKSITTNTKAASNVANCGCQCITPAITFQDDYGNSHGDCRRADETGAKWCYVQGGSNSPCQDKSYSKRYGHRQAWSYQACDTPSTTRPGSVCYTGYNNGGYGGSSGNFQNSQQVVCKGSSCGNSGNYGNNYGNNGGNSGYNNGGFNGNNGGFNGNNGGFNNGNNGGFNSNSGGCARGSKCYTGSSGSSGSLTAILGGSSGGYGGSNGGYGGSNGGYGGSNSGFGGSNGNFNDRGSTNNRKATTNNKISEDKVNFGRK